MSIYDGTTGPVVNLYVDAAQLGANAFVLGTSLLSSTTGDQLGFDVRRNLCVNPSFTYGTTSWIASFSTLSTTTPATLPTTNTSKVLVVTATSSTQKPTAVSDYLMTPVTAGSTYTVSGYFAVPSGSTQIIALASLQFLTSSGLQTGITTTSPTNVNFSSGWVRVTLTVTAPASSAYVRIRFYDNSTTPTVGSTFYVGAVLLERSSAVGAFFDGDSDECYWTSTAGNSVSAQRYNWVAIPTTDARSVSIRRGRTREDQTFQPGQMTVVLDNRSGNYDPQMLYSTYSNGTYSMIGAGTGMRVTATWSGTEYALYTGFIESVDISQDLDPTVTITCVDGMKQLANNTTTILDSGAGGLGMATSDYCALVLADFGWRAGSSLSGAVRLATRVLTGNTTTSLALLEYAINPQGGRCFVDRTGKLVAQGYEYIVPAGAAVLTLSDQRASGTIEYDAIQITPGSKYLRNQVVLTEEHGFVTTYRNASSTARYGVVNADIQTLVMDSDALYDTIGQYLADHFATAAYRVDNVGFDVWNLNGLGGSVWASFLALELGQKVSVARTPVYTTAQTYTSLVQAINHDITPNGWRCELQLSPAS